MFLPFASTPRSSGRALAQLLLEVPAPWAPGAYVDHRLRTLPASERARDTAFQGEVPGDKPGPPRARDRPGAAGRVTVVLGCRPRSVARIWSDASRDGAPALEPS